MITTSKTIPAFDTYHSYLGYSPDTSLFFDIETTGLSSASAMVFLIGAIYFDGENWLLTQWLAQSRADEAAILSAFFDVARDYDTLIHFNGATFDLPFLKERASQNQIAHPLDEKQSLDLYQKFRPLKKPLSLERMNQTTLEAFLNWPREDRLSGKQMISLFQKYAASGEPGLLDLLLLHNHDDLIGMTRLLCLSAYLLLFEGRLASIEVAPLKQPGASGTATDARLLLTLLAPLPAPFARERGFRLCVSKTQGQLAIPCVFGELRYFFPDYKNYYYLPLEDMAVHKSVAAYVDKEYRTPAKPANCYIKKTGLFLPQPEEIFTPVFRTSWESRELFFEYTDSFAEDPALLMKYVHAVLRVLKTS